VYKKANFLRSQFSTLQVIKQGWRGNLLSIVFASSNSTWPQLWQVPAAEAEQFFVEFLSLTFGRKKWSIKSVNHMAEWGETFGWWRIVRVVFDVEETEPTKSAEGVLEDLPGPAFIRTLTGDIKTK